MPYSPAHKQNTRTRIVQAARKLFNLRGFAAVSIDEIMGEAGLTHGGFYKHFARKEDLYQEAEYADPERQGRGQVRRGRHAGPAARRRPRRTRARSSPRR